MLFAILGWILFGLVVGAIARLLMPGRQRLGLVMTILLGVAGSFAGGFISTLLFEQPQGFVRHSGWLMSILGAFLVLWLYLKLTDRR